MVSSRERPQGFVILSILAIAAVIGALAVAFWTYVLRDEGFQSRQMAREQAFLYARDGIEYVASHPVSSLPTQPDGTHTLDVGTKSGLLLRRSRYDHRHHHLDRKRAGWHLRVLACRRLSAPPTNLDRYYEVDP